MPRAYNNPGNYLPVPTVKYKKPNHGGKLYNTKGKRKKQVTKILRDMDILKLREDGLSYEVIADKMTANGQSITPNGCATIVNRLITNILENSKESLENVRELELRRLDNMLDAATTMMKSTRAKAFIRLGAMDRVLRIQERRAKLLGLDIHKVEHTGEVAVRIYHGIERPGELIQLEQDPPDEGEFTMVEGTKNASISANLCPDDTGESPGTVPE